MADEWVEDDEALEAAEDLTQEQIDAAFERIISKA